MDDLEKSVRRIVSQSDLNIITKRMVRAEYMKQHSLTSMSSHLEKAINQVLHDIIQELSNLLKQGHTLESLKLCDIVEVLEVEKNNSVTTPCEKSKIHVKKLNDLNIEENKLKSNQENLRVILQDECPKPFLKRNYRVCQSNKGHPLEFIFDEQRSKNYTTKKKRSQFLSADEVRDSLLTSDDSRDTGYSESFSPDKEEKSASNWEEDVALLSTSSDSDTKKTEQKPDCSSSSISKHSHECEEKLHFCDILLDTTSVKSPLSNIEVIVVDSSPEITQVKKTRRKINHNNNRNWLNLFSDEEVKTMILDESLPYDSDNCDSTTDTAQMFSQKMPKYTAGHCEQRSGHNILKINAAQNKNVNIVDSSSSPQKERKKTKVTIEYAYNCDNSSGIDRQIFKETYSVNNDRYLKSRHRGKNLCVSVESVPKNSVNIEEIIDLTIQV